MKTTRMSLYVNSGFLCLVNPFKNWLYEYYLVVFLQNCVNWTWFYWLLTLFFLLVDPPKIVKPTSLAIEADRSKNVTVECVAGANPSPSYVWTNAAGGIETRGRFLNVQNVDELDDRNYTYTCTATNILGFDKHSVLIKFTSRFHQYFNILIEKKERKEGLMWLFCYTFNISYLWSSTNFFSTVKKNLNMFKVW